MDFSKFDAQINSAELSKAIEDAAKNPQYEGREVPAGQYEVNLERMEIKATKDGRPMFSVMMRICSGEYKKMCLFMNRVLYGTKNDANMISSVLGWLRKLEPDADDIGFENYTQFSELVLDIFEELTEAVTIEVDYDPDAFNNISIIEVVDLPF